MLQCRIEEAWTNLYYFALDPWLPVDYQFAKYYHSHAPDSPFVQRWMCTMPTQEGRKIFTGKLLKVRGYGGTQELHVASEGECKKLLQEHFGVTINDHLRFFGLGGD